MKIAGWMLVLAWALGAVAVWVVANKPVVPTHVIGVISECGYYAVITVKSDGSAEVETRDKDPNELAKQVPVEKRIAVRVPCPPTRT